MRAGRSKTSGEAFAVGLDQDREAAVAAGDRQQVGRPLALLPERRARARPAARQEQRPGGVLAEAGREQGRIGQLADDQVLDLLGIGKQEILDPVCQRSGGKRPVSAIQVAFGQPDRDPIVGPDRLDRGAKALPEARLEGQRPGRVHAAAERRKQAHPPVAKLVAEALDDNPPVGRQGAGRVELVLEVRHEVLGGEWIKVVSGGETLEGCRPTARSPAEVGLELADQTAERLAELDRPADRVTVPERELAWHTRRRLDEHPIVADLDHPP